MKVELTEALKQYRLGVIKRSHQKLLEKKGGVETVKPIEEIRISGYEEDIDQEYHLVLTKEEKELLVIP